MFYVLHPSFMCHNLFKATKIQLAPKFYLKKNNEFQISALLLEVRAPKILGKEKKVFRFSMCKKTEIFHGFLLAKGQPPSLQ